MTHNAVTRGCRFAGRDNAHRDTRAGRFWRREAAEHQHGIGRRTGGVEGDRRSQGQCDRLSTVKRTGPFKSGDDLNKVKGIGDKLLATLRPRVAVGSSAAATGCGRRSRGEAVIQSGGGNRGRRCVFRLSTHTVQASRPGVYFVSSGLTSERRFCFQALD